MPRELHLERGEERNLQESSFLFDIGRPPKSKRRKRKSHALQLLYHYIMFYESEGKHLSFGDHNKEDTIGQVWCSIIM